MKIGLPSEGETINNYFAANFGRCPFFIIFDTLTNKIITAYPNNAQNAAGGAGIQAAQSLINDQVDTVIVPQIGPNAWNVLKNANIKIYTGIPGTVQENINAILSGKLEETRTAAGRGFRRGGRGMGMGMGQGQGRGQRQR